jgi:hypothetical protein
MTLDFQLGCISPDINGYNLRVRMSHLDFFRETFLQYFVDDVYCIHIQNMEVH